MKTTMKEGANRDWSNATFARAPFDPSNMDIPTHLRS